MNILQILPELNVGGVETGTVDLAKYLVGLGHKAVVVSGGGELVKELEAGGVVHYQLPVHKKSIFTIFKMIPRLTQIIKSEKIDIVHARSRVPAWIAYFACRKTGVVFITTCHGYYKKHFFSRVMGWGKRVIVLSNVIGRHMMDDFGVPYERIRLVPRSVNLERFRYIPPNEKKSDYFNVGIIGRITPIKGHLYFIKAMAKVARVVPNLKIWIVGDAPDSKAAYKEKVQILVRRLGLRNQTEFLGTQRDIPGILSNLNLLILATTTQEAFGRVIIEAQAAGVPVIATRVGGVVDIIEDGKNGLLVYPADPEDMANKTIRIFKDSELARRMAEEGYKRVKERYDVVKMAEATLRIYEDALRSLNILIIKLSSLGDIILSTPALRAIREKYPSVADHTGNLTGHKISFLVSQEYKEVLFNSPYIDELLVADFKNRDKGPLGFMRLAGQLRKRNFDIVIDLQNNRKSHLLAWFTMSLQRYGYHNKKFGVLLNRRIKDEKLAIDPVTHQFRILKMLGIDLKNSRLELWPLPEDEQYIEEFLKAQWLSRNQRLIGINISSSLRWITKNWPISHIARLCEEIARRDMRVVLTGTEKDSKIASALLETVKNSKPINACARTTINQLACLIKRCAVYISADSAPLHIAVGVGTPVVGLFGPTDPLRHFVPTETAVVIKKELACSSCYKSHCKSRKCMELITVEEVLEAVNKLLK